ncbi:hypothetical protein PW52_13690 [Tamlana sedimentorum]|uniref:Secretion system C-terminal sorting domain-containing protein n=1 Tax=Neotamlana sedimentorum TaxID=1435349 RepID=A0A0D7W549_9FLAO|nr:hypothetical protein [Tamlana sedimentorum]KJD34236.1 hypothetical protein PW52_13690 [Tamlana sedimentorum]
MAFACTFIKVKNSTRSRMIESPKDNSQDKLYMSIDHLKKGVYILHVLHNNKVIKSIEIIKD